MWETSDAATLLRLGAGLTTLTSRQKGAQAVQPLIDAIKIPWVVGKSDDILIEALQKRLQPSTDVNQATPDLWQVIARAQQQFGSDVDLT